MFRNINRGRIAALALVALVALSAIGVTAAATVSSQSVTLQDPANETVEVDVDFASSTSATVYLNGSSSTLDSSSLSGTSGDTLTATLSPGPVQSGDYSLVIESADAANVTLNETRLVATREAEVTNATEEPLVIDVGFNASENASADLTVTNESGSTLLTDTLNYTASDYAGNETTLTREYNASDGIEAGNLTATISISSASAFENAYAQAGGSGGLFGGGTIAGQDPAVALGGLAIAIGAFMFARRQ